MPIDEENVPIDEDNDLNVDKFLLMNEVRVLNLGKLCSSGGFHDLISADEVKEAMSDEPLYPRTNNRETAGYDTVSRTQN